MRKGILAAMLGCAVACAGLAHAQKTVLPGASSTPPPKQMLPGNPTTPPPMRSPDSDNSIGRTESYRGSQGPSLGSGSTGQGMTREEARGRFQLCMDQNTRNGALSGQGMANCVAGWMPSAELGRFNACWNDPKTSAWECFGRAYN